MIRVECGRPAADARGLVALWILCAVFKTPSRNISFCSVVLVVVVLLFVVSMYSRAPYPIRSCSGELGIRVHVCVWKREKRGKNANNLSVLFKTTNKR